MTGRAVAPFLAGLAIVLLAHRAPHFATPNVDSSEVASAWLASRGWAPHRDFVRAEPPLATWLAAPFVRVFGHPAATSRVVMLGFAALALAVLFRLNRRMARPFSFVLFALLLALGHVLYSGHLFLSDTFAAFALLVVFVQFWESESSSVSDPRTTVSWVIVSLAAFLATLSLFAAIIPLALLFAGHLATRAAASDRRAANALRALVLLAGPFLAALVYFVTTGSLDDFLRQAARLGPFDPFRGFALFLESAFFLHGALECALAWTHIAVVVALLAEGRRFRPVLYLLYIGMLMAPRAGGSHAAPYIVHTLWIASWLLEPTLRNVLGWFKIVDREASMADLARVAGLAVLIALLAGSYAASVSLYAHPEPRLSEPADIAARLTRPGERLATFPAAPTLYFEAEREPASAGLGWLPWTDPSGRLVDDWARSVESQRAEVLLLDWWTHALWPTGLRALPPRLREAVRRNYAPISIASPQFYGRRASINALVGRHFAIERRPIISVGESDLFPIPLYGGAPLEQSFSLARKISRPKIDVLVSPPKTDTWLEFVLGATEQGRERLLARDRLRVGRAAPGFGEPPRARFDLPLGDLDELTSGRYFLRLDSTAAESRDGLQVWTAPRAESSPVEPVRAGGMASSRSICLRLSGVADRVTGPYPILEQSLARHPIFFEKDRLYCQTLALAEPTTVAALSVLVGKDKGPADRLVVSLLQGDQVLTSGACAAPETEREWTTIVFGRPVFFPAGEPASFVFSVAGSGRITAWRAGCDVIPNAAISDGILPMDDALCFRLYSAPPPTAAPDIAITSFELEPTSPATVMPKGRLFVELALENRGTSATGHFWVEFFALSDDFSGPVRFLIDSVNLSLGPGETYRRRMDATLLPLEPGAYSLLVEADRPGDVFELSEENNRFEPAARVRVASRPTRTNLYVSQAGVTRMEFRRGETVDFTGLISNTGDEPAGRCAIEFWTADDPAGRVRRFAICDPIVLESVRPNEIIDLSDYRRTLRRDMPAGYRILGCTVDARDEVVETNELDNTACIGQRLIRP